MNMIENAEPELKESQPSRIDSWTGRCHDLIARVKRIVREQMRPRFTGNKRILNQALKEAEALAFETPYPLLFLPALAEEKVAVLNRGSGLGQSIH